MIIIIIIIIIIIYWPGIVVRMLGFQLRSPVFESQVEWRQNWFIFSNAVTSHGSKLNVCDLANMAGAEGWKSDSPVCLSEVCVYVCEYITIRMKNKHQ